MTVFDDMHDALFDDPNLAADALYHAPGGGPAVSCRAIFLQRDQNWNGGLTGARGLQTIVEIRRSELATVLENAVLSVAGRRYHIASASLDAHGIWSIGLQDDNDP